MKLEQGIKLAKQLKLIGGTKALALAIHDELTEYSDNVDIFGVAGAQRNLSDKSRLILGLKYAEFFIDYEDRYLRVEEKRTLKYTRAEEKKTIILEMLGIDRDELYYETEKLYGRGEKTK